ncbi:MAG TPA: serine hydrolase domain-containing protein [Sedimentisphaerales bacterium]|nr:serine hydrolase domain-containing protein [Sedimentisphaerales bacterium]
MGLTDMKLIRKITTLLTLLLCVATGCRPVQKEICEQRFSRIENVIEEEIEKGNFPGAVVLVGKQSDILYWQAFGNEVIEPFEETINGNTIFDLASLAKPIATATSIMILKDRKALDLDDYVGAYLPAFACNGKEEVRIKHLLSHTSGLPAYTNANKLKEQFGSPCPDEVIEKIYKLEAVSKPGEEFRYSCLGYITLAKIVETVSGKSISDFSRENIFIRLGMKHTAYTPPDSWEEDIAATEIVDGQLLRGAVHDPLAKLMGGISGNAGLFSNAYDLSIYCRMLLNEGVWNGTRVLSPEAVAMLTTSQAYGRAYGFDVNSSYSSVKGTYAPKKAFCHTGYTGTSIVCDPVSGTFVIILTNRVHPSDEGTAKPVRSKVADIVFSSLQMTP